MRQLKSFFRKINRLRYKIRCMLFPFNIVKLHSLPRTWCDRDCIMLHAMFQILVDFVELEQPFHSCFDYASKRLTDRIVMNQYIKDNYGPDSYTAYHFEWMTNDDKKNADKQTAKLFMIYSEIMYLYEWYKDEKYDFDKSGAYELTGKDLKLENIGIKEIDNGKPKLITFNELNEMEEEHEILCDIMLRRILSIRKYLWT